MKDELIQRQFVIKVIFIIFSLTLVGKLFYLQILDSSLGNRAQSVTISRHYTYPSRGLIFDRNGKQLIINEPIFDISVVVKEITPQMDTLKFCKLLGINRMTFDSILNKDWQSKRFSKALPFTFLTGLDPKMIAPLSEQLYQFSGFYLQTREHRSYPFPHAANILGYLSEVTEKDIDKNEGKYFPGDYIGSSGVELSYDEQLRGSRGIRYGLRNSRGKEVDSYQGGNFDIAAIAGQDLIGSFDIDLQAFAEELLSNKTGSIVAIEPSTGEVLALATSPNFDPNLLAVGPERGKAYQKLATDTLKPFFDRTIMAKYPPGSVFKTLVGLIALEEGLTTPNRYIPCSGSYYYGTIKWGCHHHVPITSMASALQHSCNSYFFQLTRDIIDQYSFHLPGKGLNIFVEYLSEFGLGHTIGIDYPHEKAGNVPTPTYYDKLYKKRRGWRSPTIMSIGIVQGEIQLTTLQMANIAAIIANRGYFYTPHLIKGYKNPVWKIDSSFYKKHTAKISPNNFQPVVDGMERVVLYGTGRQAYIPGISVAGKTGTSQNSQGEDHSVFFGFAPVNAPKIAVAVLIENAGRGAEFAAPIASLIMEKYLTGTTTRTALFERMKSINTVRIKKKSSIRKGAGQLPGDTSLIKIPTAQINNSTNNDN